MLRQTRTARLGRRPSSSQTSTGTIHWPGRYRNAQEPSRSAQAEPETRDAQGSGQNEENEDENHEIHYSEDNMELQV